MPSQIKQLTPDVTNLVREPFGIPTVDLPLASAYGGVLPEQNDKRACTRLSLF
jgi:hypothetical protein